jgi:hypothetical protein
MADLNDPIYRSLRPLQMIILAMMVGILAFATVAVAVSRQFGHEADLAPRLLLILAAVGLGELLVYRALRRAAIDKLRKALEQDPAGQIRPTTLAPGLMNLRIITAAMAEGFALFGIVVFLVTGTAVALAAPVIALVILTRLVPTRDRVSRFIAELSGQPLPR